MCDTHQKCSNVTVHALCAKSVRATGECMYTHSVVHTVVATTCERNLQKLCRENSVQNKNQHSPFLDHLDKKIFNSSSGFGTLLKILRLHFSKSALIFLAGTCSMRWLFINHRDWKLLGFPKHASLRDRSSLSLDFR